MMMLSVLWFWLTLPSTLIAVVGPLFVFVGGFALLPAARQMAPRMLIWALLSAPISVALSRWDGGGLHVAPVVMAPLTILMLAGSLNLRRHWFAVAFGVWLGTIVPDAIVAWQAHGSPVYTAPTWYWGVGGYGLNDGLVQYPLILSATLFVLQEALNRGWFRVEVWKR